ncbi:membrane protein involved in D-alanine export DltB-like protein [Psychroflexus gondwanensis ACAM 44]|jgi:alginate O-acetyltransferase complex protein AlgI|uniref:Membrane protein involved in D-alanine export DltB-like protein n=1 Tax=Psychroflexus gondwanensis ACAM 44 TaxID=1189619 RepID=N1WTZ9_9FLAO|nr:MBOAT family O-acyltransferase [Psychroflexus gondwanensis]EMY80682.1 membrane protein involved in D-alanine export DltB-like protein [Psychroflexus gondwanensis ACAM 44]
MLFNSLTFVVFLVIVLALYYSKILSWTSKKGMLLLASYLFYGLWNPPLVILLWISTMVDWTAGKKLAAEESQRKRKFWLLLSLFVNLGFLAFFKYRDFLLDNFTSAVNAYGYGYEAQPMDIILPMGISFYTFQTMSYTIDIYKRKIEPAHTFLDFALYVTFFPQLVAGPIVRAQDLITQFYEEKRANFNQFAWGTFLLTIGLFQKIVLADILLADTSDQVFSSTAILHGVDAWTGTLAFSGQIFFDFAGYSTCAIGIALMLGIVLPDNFKYPYASIGFSDFWRRWHITLSSWLRDYIYIPLGGNQHGITRMYAALIITMLLGGLWHGAAWTFVIWGALHGLYLIMERLLRSKIHIKINAINGIFLALLTYIMVNFTWVFFRAREFATAKNMIISMLFINGEGEKIVETFDVIKVFLLISLLFMCHWMMRNTSMKEVSLKVNPWILGVFWAFMVFLIVISQGSGEQFIYFQF